MLSPCALNCAVYAVTAGNKIVHFVADIDSYLSEMHLYFRKERINFAYLADNIRLGII